MNPETVLIATTEEMKAITSCLRKMDFKRITSGRLAPAEDIINAITGPRAIPFAIRICEMGIILDKRMYKGIPMIAATGINHQLSRPNHSAIKWVGTNPCMAAPIKAPIKR